MYIVKCENYADFYCSKDLRENFVDISLVHMGKEECRPYHAFSGTRDEYIIHFILSGYGFYSANGNTWSLGPGQMFLLYPEEPVVYCADRNTPWTYVWIGFKGFGTDTILKHCGFSKNHLVLLTPALDEYVRCFDDLFEHTTRSFSDGFYRESVLRKLMAILAEHYKQLVTEERQEKTDYGSNVYVNTAIDYINEMYMKNIGVCDIANKIGITQSYLNHVFQKELNISVQRFLIDFRMHKAANLLVSTPMSIKEISNKVGYNDQLVFSKAFKKKFGMSPKNYRIYTDEEYQTHFSLWAMMNSPLMIGCDVRKLTDETKKILMNQDLIAINQDIECRAPFQLNCESNSPDVFTLVKFLSDGDIAIGLFNMGDVPTMVAIDFWDMGFTTSAGRSLEFFDCIEHKHLGKKEEMFSDTVAAHGSKVYRCRVVKK